MELKQAVALAKAEIANVFADEKVSDLGLEEVVFDDIQNRWKITIGFNRPLKTGGPLLISIFPDLSRAYKVVEIQSGTGKVISILDRRLQSAA